MNKLRGTILTIGLSCLPFNVIGQTKAQNVPQPSVAQQQREIADLRGQISSLQKKVEELESRVSVVFDLLKYKQDRQDSVTLDLSERSYQRIDTDNGFFLISAEQAVPYLNGYKIVLKIGNPLSVSYSGFTAKIKWAKKYDYNQYAAESYDAWQKSVQEKEVSFTDDLERGTWNKIELIVTPATAEQLGYVNLSLSTNTVRMYEK
jgi:hypothetical protein